MVNEVRKVNRQQILDKSLIEKMKEESERMFENNPNTPKGWIYIGDDKVRYALGEPGSYNLLVIGLNPGIATPDKPDPTIKRIRKIAEKENMEGS